MTFSPILKQLSTTNPKQISRSEALTTSRVNPLEIGIPRFFKWIGIRVNFNHTALHPFTRRLRQTEVHQAQQPHSNHFELTRLLSLKSKEDRGSIGLPSPQNHLTCSQIWNKYFRFLSIWREVMPFYAKTKPQKNIQFLKVKWCHFKWNHQYTQQLPNKL
jgi:hypothetical protein